MTTETVVPESGTPEMVELEEMHADPPSPPRDGDTLTAGTSQVSVGVSKSSASTSQVPVKDPVPQVFYLIVLLATLCPAYFFSGTIT